MRPIAIASGLAALLAVSAAAHDNYFIPGDAYFASALTQKSKLAAPLSLDCVRFENKSMGCGYLGYRVLRLTIDKVQLDHLKTLHKRLFAKHLALAPRYGNEAKTPFFPLLVYRGDFDFQKQRLWLPYNENSVKVQKVEAKREHASWSGPEPKAKALRAIDARDARAVPPLTIDKRPPIAGFMGVDAPMHTRGADKMFVVLLGGPRLEDFSRRKDGLQFYVVKDGIARYRFAGGKVVLVEKLPD